MSHRRWVKTTLLVLAWGATGFGVDLPAQNPAPGIASRPEANGKTSTSNDVPVHLVTQGKLGVTVVERGIVEPCWTTSECCRLRGGTPISWILPDGTIVLAGQPICQLGTKNESGMIFASVGGILVHPNELDRRGGQPVSQFGATVRMGEEIFSIVDDHGPMQVDVKVPERVIDQIDRGLRARIKIDAFPEDLVTGTVSEVAPLPDPMFFFQGAVKTYTTKIQIDHGPAGIRPGMLVELEIFVNEIENVLSVPVQAVVHKDGRDRLAVQKSDGQFEWREVTLGQSNERLVEVTHGVKSGDLVATRPRGLLSGQGRMPVRATRPTSAPSSTTGTSSPGFEARTAPWPPVDSFV